MLDVLMRNGSGGVANTGCLVRRAYRNEVLLDSRALLGIKPALGVVNTGVFAEEGLVAVDDPGVYAEDCLEDLLGRGRYCVWKGGGDVLRL